jgi:uncharacterized protein YkwD
VDGERIGAATNGVGGAATRRRLLACAATGALASALGVRPRPAGAADPAPCDIAAADEVRAILQRVNAHRAANGLGPLALDLVLCRAAHTKSAAMARAGKLSHTVEGVDYEENLANAGYPVAEAATGENIAYGYPSAKRVFKAWRRSNGHNANMLRPDFAAIGIARVKNRKGVPYWTQTFGSLVVDPADACPVG